MRRCLQEFCSSLFGRPAPHTPRPLVDKSDANEDESYENDEKIDSSLWELRDIKPQQIKDSDLTKEYVVRFQDREQKLNSLGYTLGNDIGKGAFGRVRLITKIKDQATKTFACKIIQVKTHLAYAKELESGSKDKSQMTNFKNELFVLVKSKHKNIIKVVHHFIINHECFLVMEYANCGNMYTDIKKRGPYSEREAMAYFAQISSAVYYLHCKLGIAHSDLKPANFLIFAEGKGKDLDDFNKRTIKVADFGLSKLRIDKNKEVIKDTDPRGTLPYMSPQVLTQYVIDRLDEESVFGKTAAFNPFIADIWSLGVCLFLMLFREFPFETADDPRLMRNVLESQIHQNFKFPPKYAKNLSNGCTDMMEDCLEPNPQKRLTIQNIVCHYWFEDHYSIEELSETPDN